ncbi:phage holin family protein [Kushneria sp. TE3]|uniref:phage holin family protein n=1 Tax=Kushneria sp. TE3 TaxID=3449832 RepID=UPI003F687E80
MTSFFLLPLPDNYAWMMVQPDQLPTICALLISLAICGRLLTYRRRGARYRRRISWLAYGLFVGSGTLAIQILAGRYIALPISWSFVILLAVCAVLIYRARGNVAHIVRVNA